MNSLLKIYIFGFVCGFGLCAVWLYFYPPQLDYPHTLLIEPVDEAQAQEWCLKQGYCMDILTWDDVDLKDFEQGAGCFTDDECCKQFPNKCADFMRAVESNE